MRISYASSFYRQFKALSRETQKEALQAIEMFAVRKNHIRLKVHKLKGNLSDRFSFSVNYKMRIIFRYEKVDSAILLAIGDHDVYRT